MRILEHCPVCETSSVHGARAVLKRRVHRGKLHLLCVFERCLECGHVYLNPQPTPDELNVFYDGDYHVFRDRPHTPEQISELLRERFDGVRLNHAHFLAGGTYLDVGCGLGNMVAAAQSVGMTAMGVDISPIAVAIGRKNGRDLRAGALSDHDFASNSFDSISMYHSLEHTPDPVTTLRECARILKPGAVLMVAVPNFDSLAHAWIGRSWRHLDPPYHLQHFTRNSLERAGRAAGLRLGEMATESFVDHIEQDFALWARQHLAVPQRLSHRLRAFSPLARWLYARAVREDRGDALIAHFVKEPSVEVVAALGDPVDGVAPEGLARALHRRGEVSEDVDPLGAVSHPSRALE